MHPNHNDLITLMRVNAEAFEKVATPLDTIIEPACMGMRDASLTQLVEAYELINYLLEALKTLSTQCNKQETFLAEAITKKMMNEDMDEVVFNGYKYTPSNKTYISVASDNRETVIKWLKSSSDGRELVKEDFNIKSLTAMVIQLKEAGVTDIPKEITTYEKPTLSVRKLPGKRK